jgi:predicted nucleic acid-binding protein
MGPDLAHGDLVRAVLDVSVLVSGVLSAKGASAEILRASRDGEFELVVSEMLLAELTRTLAYPRLRKRIPQDKAPSYADWALTAAPSGVRRSPSPASERIVRRPGDHRDRRR